MLFFFFFASKNEDTWPVCVTTVCMCVRMFCISLPLKGSFSQRYTITLTGLLICKPG